MTVVYNAIDSVRFAPGVGDGARLDGLAGVPIALQGTVRVGLVATYARWKGQDLFMMAIDRVQSVRPGPLLHRRRADLQDEGITVFGREAPRAGRQTGSGRSSGIRAVPGRNSRCVPRGRRGDTRQYTSGAVRSDDRRGDGLQPPGGRGERRRRVRVSSPKARMPWESRRAIPTPWPKPWTGSSITTRSCHAIRRTCKSNGPDPLRQGETGARHRGCLCAAHSTSHVSHLN